MVVEFLLESNPILLYLINKSQLYLVMRYLAAVDKPADIPGLSNKISIWRIWKLLHQIPKNYIQDSLRSFYRGKSIWSQLVPAQWP